MSTKPKQTAQDLIKEGRHALSIVQEHMADFALADKGRLRPLLPAAFIKKFESDVESADTALGDSASVKVDGKAATTDERTQRATLFDLLGDVRSDVTLAYPEDKDIARAFGMGLRVPKTSTPQLLNWAGLVTSSYKDAAKKKMAVAAGVTPARIAEVAKAAKALSSADTTQDKKRSSARAVATNKKALLLAVRTGAARIRKVAARVFKKQPDVLAKFKTTLSRATPKKRAAKKTEENK